MNHARKLLHLAFIALAALATACGGGGGGSSGGTASDYISAVSSSDGSLHATFHAGVPPTAAASASVQAASVASGAFLPGGTSSFEISATATRVIIYVDGVDGYWELTGLTAGAGQVVLVTFAQTSHPTYTLQLGSGTAAGITGYTPFPIAYTSVGTGDVQVNVTWDLDVDVDLHVMDPNGVEIYYGNDAPSTGGELDLDSNAGCSLDHVKAENITWATGTAPAGTYKVAVDYYEACTTGTVHYVVTVNRKGHAAETFQGTLTLDDHGGAIIDPANNAVLGEGVFITHFTMP